MPDQRKDVRGYRNEKKTTAFDDLFEFDNDRSMRYDNETPDFREDQGAFSMPGNSFQQAFDTDIFSYDEDGNSDNPFAAKKKTTKTNKVVNAAKPTAATKTNTTNKTKKANATKKPRRVPQESDEFAAEHQAFTRRMDEDRFFMEEQVRDNSEKETFEKAAPQEEVLKRGMENGRARRQTAPSKSDNKEKKMRAGLFQYGAAAFGITLIALIFILLVNVVGSFSADTLNYTLKKGGEISLTESTRVWVKDQTIITADSNSVNAYNSQRSLIWNYNCALAAPQITSNDQYAVIYDTAGTDYILLNQSGVLYSHSSDGKMPILKASVNRTGYVVLICGTEEMQQLQIFAPSGDLLLRRSTKQDSSGVLLDSLMSDDSKYLITLSLQYSESSAGSQITVFNLNSAGDGLNDSINSNFVFDDTLLFALIPMNRGMAVLGDNRLLGYASGNTWKENWNERLTNRITAYCASGDALALTFGNELTPVSSGLDGKTVVYAYGGDQLSAPEEGITYFQVDEKFQVYQKNGVFYCTNSKDKIFWRYAAEDEIQKVYLCGEQWILQTPSALKIMNLSVLDSE